jgi:putative Mg2+ transporter-C (MgtC) family protein
MNLFDQDLIIPIVCAIIAGGLIGAEREYRSSPAGFRTHILVSLSCCLLMLSAVHQVRWLTDTPADIIRIDPVRMAHGLLTGVGFLCGGVIFRDGFNVRGLTTAASLWSTSGLGILFGVGFSTLALIGSIATLLVLGAANVTDKVFPQRKLARLIVRYSRSSSPSRENFCRLVQDVGFAPAVVSLNVSSDIVEYSVTLNGADDASTDRFLSNLGNDGAIIGYEYIPHDA